MICERCHGTRMVELAPCPDCIGGVASCCDAAGSAEPIDLAEEERRAARADPRQMSLEPMAAYADDAFPERACDFCGKLYRGPAVYCSLECALADA